MPTGAMVSDAELKSLVAEFSKARSEFEGKSNIKAFERGSIDYTRP